MGQVGGLLLLLLILLLLLLLLLILLLVLLLLLPLTLPLILLIKNPYFLSPLQLLSSPEELFSDVVLEVGEKEGR